MPALHDVRPRSTGTGAQSSQSLLQHSYFIAAVAIVFALVVLRIIVLRWRNQSLADFFRIGGTSQYSYGSQQQSDSNYGSLYHGLQLAPLPAAYHPDRRLRAMDIDVHGRRLDPSEENWEGKDALPVYDSLDRPPKYIEAGWAHGGLPTEQPSPPEGEQSGMAHPSTPGGAPGDSENQALATAGGAHGTEAPSPPTHTDSAGS